MKEDEISMDIEMNHLLDMPRDGRLSWWSLMKQPACTMFEKTVDTPRERSYRIKVKK